MNNLFNKLFIWLARKREIKHKQRLIKNIREGIIYMTQLSRISEQVLGSSGLFTIAESLPSDPESVITLAKEMESINLESLCLRDLNSIWNRINETIDMLHHNIGTGQLVSIALKTGKPIEGRLNTKTLEVDQIS